MESDKKKSRSKMLNAGMTSSNHDDWGTPPAFFENLNTEFHFDVDVCAGAENAKCKEFYTKEMDGLSISWGDGRVYWMNPPYGRQIGKWVEKAFRSSKEGSTVVCLVPARTDTVWWHDYCMKGEVRFVKGRLCFVRGDSTDRAPFPSAVVVFRPMQ